MTNDELLIAVKDMFEVSVGKMEEMNRHNGILLEDLHKDVKLLAEGHSILNDRMNIIERKFDGLETKVDRLETKVDRLETKVDRLENKFNYLETDMSIVKGYVIGVDRKLNEHESVLKRIK